MTDIKVGAIDGVIHISTEGFKSVVKDIRANVIDECIEYFSIHAHEIYNHISARDFICDRLEQLKDK